MKKIEAYIRPEKLEEIKEVMDKLNLTGGGCCRLYCR